MQALVLGGHVEMAGVGGREQFDLFAHDSIPQRQSFTPRERSSARTVSMPFFSIVRSPLAEMRKETQRFSVSTQKRCVCRLGRKRRRFLLFAWETRFPTAGFLPVTSQTRDIRLP